MTRTNNDMTEVMKEEQDLIVGTLITEGKMAMATLIAQEMHTKDEEDPQRSEDQERLWNSILQGELTYLNIFATELFQVELKDEKLSIDSRKPETSQRRMYGLLLQRYLNSFVIQPLNLTARRVKRRREFHPVRLLQEHRS